LTVIVVALPPLTALGIAQALTTAPEPLAVELVEHRDKALEQVRDGGVELVIVDPGQPTLSDGLKYCQQLKEVDWPPRVLAFSGLRDERDLMYCLLAGMDSFVAGDQRPERLAAAVRSTLTGNREWVLGPRGRGRWPEPETTAELSPRERDVLWMVRDRHTNQQIAVALSISPNTVKNHVAAILRKLGARRRAELYPGATAHEPRRPG